MGQVMKMEYVISLAEINRYDRQKEAPMAHANRWIDYLDAAHTGSRTCRLFACPWLEGAPIPRSNRKLQIKKPVTITPYFKEVITFYLT